MSKQCVAFARLASANYTVDLDKVDGKTCSELIDFLNDQKLNDETIAISTPCFREALPLESKPIELYKELILSERPTKFDRPDFFICIIPNNDANKKVFYMEAIVQNNISMPRWEVEIDPSDFENELSSSLCSFLISKFPYEIEENTESIILQNDENPVDQTMTALNMIQEMRQSRYKIKCLLSEGTLKKITFRSHIVKEIQSTEKTYIDGLQVLVHFWSNNLIGEKVLSSEEANIVFNDFPNMIKYHSLFLRNLEERGTSFNAILSDVFLDFSAFFKVSKMYISNYATFIQIFANKSKNKETSEKIKRITAAEPTGTNREISSYLITPVQRMPRYILFIRELIKHTPQAHPDAVLLKNAAIQIQKVTEQIDDSTQKAENMSKLLAIHSRLTNKFDLLLPSRNFVMKCDVYVKPQNSSGVFYLFNDMVFLTAIERKGETYIYDKPVEEFKYWNGIPNLESITFLPKSGNIKSRFQSRKDFSIQFSTQEEKNGFLEMVRNIKFELLSRSDDLNRMFIFENCPVSKLLPSVTGHDAVAFNQMLFSFGGENNGDPQNNFLLYSITQGGSSNNILPLISPRYNHAMINDNDKIYLFGGTDGSDFFNDLYIYSLKEKVWEKIQAENPPEPRSGHSLVYYKNKLYVFGGINKKKKPLNDVAIYMIDRNIWRYEIFSGSPEPRYHHSACICGSSMIIHGGKGKSNILNDIACFDLEKILWINIQINAEAIGGLLPRYGHKSFYVGGYIVFIGGADDSGIVNPTTINVNNNWTCENYLMGGNDPLSLFRFALTYEIGSHVIVYGGCEYDSKNGTSCVYTVTMPPIIASNLSESYPPDPPNKCLSDNSSYSSSDNTESEKSFSSCKSDGIKMIKMSDSFKRNTYIPTNMLPNNVREQEKENRDQQEENLTIAMLAARKARTMSLMNIQIEPKSPPLSYLFEEPVVINDEMIKHLIETEYNEEEFCQALCIDSSEIAPFQKKILTRKLNALYAKIQNNATIEKQIDSLLNISSHLDHKIPKFEVFVKLLFENQIIILKTLSTIGFKAFLKEINICIKKKCKRIMTNSHSELTHTLLLGEIKMILNNTKHHIILTVE